MKLTTLSSMILTLTATSAFAGPIAKEISRSGTSIAGQALTCVGPQGSVAIAADYGVTIALKAVPALNLQTSLTSDTQGSVCYEYLQNTRHENHKVGDVVCRNQFSLSGVADQKNVVIEVFRRLDLQGQPTEAYKARVIGLNDASLFQAEFSCATAE
jgi:hypothetical protein